jgi:hypothetical protein
VSITALAESTFVLSDFAFCIILPNWACEVAGSATASSNASAGTVKERNRSLSMMTPHVCVPRGEAHPGPTRVISTASRNCQ